MKSSFDVSGYPSPAMPLEDLIGKIREYNAKKDWGAVLFYAPRAIDLAEKEREQVMNRSISLLNRAEKYLMMASLARHYAMERVHADLDKRLECVGNIDVTDHNRAAILAEHSPYYIKYMALENALGNEVPM